MKICRWSCCRYLCNHGFLLYEKFQCPIFRYTEVIHKKLFWVFLKCKIVSDIYEHVHNFYSRSYAFTDDFILRNIRQWQNSSTTGDWIICETKLVIGWYFLLFYQYYHYDYLVIIIIADISIIAVSNTFFISNIITNIKQN